MSKRLALIISCFVFILLNLKAQSSYQAIKKTSADGKYSWQEVTNDLTKTRFYTLKNGLTVILSENHLEPRIMSLITTKAGSKNDPADHTGLAHYLEHMLFKGTDKFGTKDYEKEKILLDQIDRLYSEYNSITDKEARKRHYHKIDSISGEAAKYAIANEYDKLMATLGSNMTNAFTSFENTTYMENIPSNNLDKFLDVQAERFRKPILRLFHTELEAVYEEKNISLDDGGSKVFESMFASLFKNHPYGTQTTIGTIEHLKNPSLTEIRKYFYANYVPNNMAIILTGDFNSDDVIAMIDKKFGAWESKPVPPFTFKPEEKRTKIEKIKVYSPDEESVAIGYLMPNTNDKEALIADLVNSILYNGKSGLIDKNLVLKQKVLEAFGFTYLLKDYGMFYLGGKPLKNQTLEQVEQLIISQINDLKKGNFDEDLIIGTINNQKVSKVKERENPMNMAFVLNDIFVTDKPWAEYLKSVDNMSKITKQDVVNFANKWFGDNYTVVYKLTGVDTSIAKVEKPEITQVEVNREDQSPFLKLIVESPSKPLTPVFLDFEKDLKKGDLKKDLPVWYVPNTINGLFSTYYVLDMGKENNAKLPLAVEYLKFIGTSTMTNEQINKELYKLAVNFNIFAGDDQVYVSFSGLDENFEKAMQLIEKLLKDPKPDQEALNKLVESQIKSRNDATLNKGAIFWQGLENYAQYGAKNPFNDVISNEDLRKIKAEELTKIIKSLTGYKHKVYYYGPRKYENLVQTLRKEHATPAILKDYPAAKKYEKVNPKENTIYFVNYDMVQAEIGMTRWGQDFNPALMPKVRVFNEYYGGGMGSIVFQDIRESKALAYSAFSSYGTPDKKEDPFSSMFYVGTQADKLPLALDAMNNLLNNMPESEKLLNIGKKSIKQGYESKRITKEGILFNYQNALRLGLNYDIRKDIYNQVDKITLADVKTFEEQNLKNKNWNIKLLGSKDKINLNDLKKYGKVVELNMKDIFGYDVEQVLKP